MSHSFDDETDRLTEMLQHSAQLLLEHIQAHAAIVPLDNQSQSYIVIGDNGAMRRFCRAIAPAKKLGAAH